MITLFGALLGFLAPLLPEVFKLLTARADRAHEVAMARMQMDLVMAGHHTRMAEIGALADMAGDQTAFAASLRRSGVRWIDGANGLVRPALTFCFFVLYAAVKAAQFATIAGTGGMAATVMELWGDEDRAIWAAIVCFWFGQRSFNRSMGRA